MSVGGLLNELWLHMMYCMDGSDLYRFVLANSKLYMLSDSSHLWEATFKRSFPKTFYALKVAPYAENWSFTSGRCRKLLSLMVDGYNRSGSSEIDVIIEVMENQRHNGPMLKLSAYLVRRLAYSPAGCTNNYTKEVHENKRTFGKKNALNLLLEGITSFDSPDIADSCLCALTNLAVHSENCDVLVSNGGVQLILEAIKKWNLHHSVIEKASSCLANISREDSHCRNLVKQGEVLDILMNTLKAEDSNTEEKRHTLNLIIALTKKDNILRDELGEQILKIVSQQLDLSSHKDKIFQYLCDAIQKFCKGSDINQEVAKTLQLHHKMVQFLEKIEPNEDNGHTRPIDEILYDIMISLYYLLPCKPSNSDDIRKLIEIVIQKMALFPQEVTFQFGCVFLLTKYASDHLDYINQLKGGPLVKKAIKILPISADYELLISEFGW
eukprot:TRINITY_DN12706_c0_g1_i1.p1 TRINITY_DN12706_c0_g1~~TRINITY_DN12706_c0_g1_i1.p1  ORF type:complete len:453 (-),score=93.96 TRINITY_DN12706_c0_g1_i1:71-1387(-)